MRNKKRATPKSTSSQQLREAIRQVFKKYPNEGWTFRQLIKQVALPKVSKADIADILQAMAVKGEIFATDDSRFYANIHKNRQAQMFQQTLKSNTKAGSKNANLLEGIIEVTQNGNAFLMVEGLERDIFISSSKILNALDGDRVRARLLPQRRNSDRREGEIVEVVQRKSRLYPATLRVFRSKTIAIPDNPRIPYDFIIPADKVNQAKNNDKVAVQLLEFAPQQKKPTAEVVQVLGNKISPHFAKMEAILITHNFPLAFPPEVMEFANKIQVQLDEHEIENRVDFRGITTFTIDPADAKDFDDALSIQRLENGNWEIGVHIADVSYYCPEGSALDAEAYERATSVYLVDRVLPMFPEKLSNEVCSLRPHEDKFCFSAIFEMNTNAQVLRTHFSRTVIHSQRRFSYEEAQAIIEGGEGDFASELRTFNTLATQLRKRRFKAGSISFETPEVKFKLDEKGKPIDVYLKERKDAHMLIEDFMLLANRAVAEFFMQKKEKNKNAQQTLGVFRNHALPDEEKLEKFALMAARFGYRVDASSPQRIAQSLNKLFEQVKGKPEQYLLENLGVRTMAKADYGVENIGHYGLAFDDYTHFTSPIRRYPDVLVHRILWKLLHKQTLPNAKDLAEQTKHCSLQERNAAQAERDSVKYKQVEYLTSRIGQEYDGVISGIMNYGMFVMLEANYCEGLVPIESLTDDQYYHDEREMALVGVRRKRMYRLGSRVRVRVVSADLESVRSEFELLEKKNTKGA